MSVERTQRPVVGRTDARQTQAKVVSGAQVHITFM
jgi:hypothetical protein